MTELHYVVPPKPVSGGALAPPDVQELTLGASIADLVAFWPEWVKRRVETVRFTDDGTVRRQMSIDFELPDSNQVGDAANRCASAVANMGAVSDTPPIPLTTLDKATLEPGRVTAGIAPQLLTRFDLWDETEQRLPLLGKAQSARITGAGLAFHAKTTADDAGLPFPDVVKRYFYEVAARDPVDAEYLLRGVEGGFRTSVKRFGAHPNHDFAAFVWSLDGHEETIDAIFLANEFLRSLSRKLAHAFIVLFPAEGDLYRRRIVKLAYEAALAPSTRGAFARRLSRIGRACSWRPADYVFTELTVGTAVSHHFEIEAPEFTEIIRAQLFAIEAGRTVRVTDRSMKRYAHLRVGVTEASWAARASVEIKLRASRSGLLTAGALAAAIVAAGFWAAQPRLAHVDAAAAGALLPAIPALILAYLTRPGEHELAASMLSGVRFMLAISTVCLIAAAGAIAGGFRTHAQAIAATTTRPVGSLNRGSATPDKSATGPRPAARMRLHPTPSGPYLDDIWELLKWLTTMVAAGLLLSWLLPRRPSLKETWWNADPRAIVNSDK